MAKKDIKDFVCKPFCSFYREGEKEELICNGARLLEMLVTRGILSPDELSCVKAGSCFAAGKNLELERAVCLRCPFRPDGCDFMSKSPPPDAEPCGGYVLLDLLAACGIITGNDLEIINGT
ncbi:MAG TPA: hypothetical protein VFG19_06440 [Geobacteraceae bacterium]|nr:hypothetical protein [Geobacteraceae bacterium]